MGNKTSFAARLLQNLDKHKAEVEPALFEQLAKERLLYILQGGYGTDKEVLAEALEQIIKICSPDDKQLIHEKIYDERYTDSIFDLLLTYTETSRLFDDIGID